jgi:hypothetical protein
LTGRYREWLRQRLADKQADACLGAGLGAFVQSGCESNNRKCSFLARVWRVGVGTCLLTVTHYTVRLSSWRRPIALFSFSWLNSLYLSMCVSLFLVPVHFLLLLDSYPLSARRNCRLFLPFSSLAARFTRARSGLSWRTGAVVARRSSSCSVRPSGRMQTHRIFDT